MWDYLYQGLDFTVKNKIEAKCIIDRNGFCLVSVPPPPPPKVQYVDPTMIGVLVGMGLMFIILCVVMRLFSQ